MGRPKLEHKQTKAGKALQDQMGAYDPALADVIFRGWPTHCRRCQAKYPNRCGLCGACIGLGKTVAARLGKPGPAPRHVAGVRYRHNGAAVGVEDV